ncbi:tetratricopeptide repeat protein [bacterium]|nr:MAG: tetratricopeptide repeat protein [bacterium]
MTDFDDQGSREPGDELRHHLETARFYMLGGQWVRATNALHQALALDPDLSEAHACLSVCAFNQKDMVTARREAEMALALDSNDKYNFYALFLVELREQNFARAESAARSGLELDPECAYLHFAMYLLYVAQNRWQEAESYLRYALYLEPEDAEYRFAMANLHFVLHRKDEGDFQLQETLRIDPEHAGAQKMLGQRMLEGAQLSKSEEQFRVALQINPEDRESQSQLAVSKQLQHPFFWLYRTVLFQTKDLSVSWAHVALIAFFCAMASLRSLPLSGRSNSEAAAKAQLFYWTFCALCAAVVYFFAAEEVLAPNAIEKSSNLVRWSSFGVGVIVLGLLHWGYWALH